MGRHKGPQTVHPVCKLVVQRLRDIGMTKTEMSCELLEIMGSPKPCNRSWHSSVFRYLGGGGKVVVSPGKPIRAAMMEWLKIHPSPDK
jgi:hypothetical protein